ncbi:CPBP family intramembrane glutamic endopeptidase [Flexithrix dorotheae]|uniref:CPBP family intramembrane glutamic endopeptidase n=1 Tax=Flexithrix dorotheae TaxID=70993 RepID=UPI00036AD182|nr:type II CAAX endopeptidase family protein [Flexithrix dorotheae]
MLSKSENGRNEWWRYLLTLCSIILAIFIWQLFAEVNLVSHIEFDNEHPLGKNIIFILATFPFAIGFLALLFSLKKIHDKSLLGIINDFQKFRWNHFFKGFGLWFLISLMIIQSNFIFFPDGFEFNFQGVHFFLMVLISLVFIPIQAGFEELIFRGYLLQGFNLIANNKWVAMVLSTLLFAAVHASNPEVKAFGEFFAMGQYLFMGLLFGYVTIKDKGLEIAWGAHAANNICLSLFITNESFSLQTHALFLQHEVYPTFDLISLIIAGGCFILICWLIFKWKKEGTNT